MKHRTKITLTSNTYILYDHYTKNYTHWEEFTGGFIEKPLTIAQAQELINSNLMEDTTND